MRRRRRDHQTEKLFDADPRAACHWSPSSSDIASAAAAGSRECASQSRRGASRARPGRRTHHSLHPQRRRRSHSSRPARGFPRVEESGPWSNPAPPPPWLPPPCHYHRRRHCFPRSMGERRCRSKKSMPLRPAPGRAQAESQRRESHGPQKPPLVSPGRTPRGPRRRGPARTRRRAAPRAARARRRACRASPRRGRFPFGSSRTLKRQPATPQSHGTPGRVAFHERPSTTSAPHVWFVGSSNGP